MPQHELTNEDLPIRWKRQLEQDWLERRLALEETEELPGPGAAATMAASLSDMGIGQDADDSGVSFNLQKTLEDLEKQVTAATPVLKTRGQMWLNILDPWTTIPVLIGLHFHKAIKDRKFEAVIEKARTAIAQIANGVPKNLPAKARLIIGTVLPVAKRILSLAGFFLTAEWLLIFLLDALLAAIIYLILAIISIIAQCYINPGACAASVISDALSSVLGT